MTVSAQEGRSQGRAASQWRAGALCLVAIDLIIVLGIALFVEKRGGISYLRDRFQTPRQATVSWLASPLYTGRVDNFRALP